MQGLDFRKAFVVRGHALAGEGLQPLAWAEGKPVIADFSPDTRIRAAAMATQTASLPAMPSTPSIKL